MDKFFTIRFRRTTAQRFKRFSKKVSGSYSESMEMMINFFEWHGFLPSEKFEKSIGKEIIRNRKRTDALMSVIRNIEKHQTKPATAMLKLLFEHSPNKKSGQAPLLMEGKEADPEKEMFFKKVEKAIEMEREHTDIKRDYGQLKLQFIDLLNKVQLVKVGFGKPRLQLEISPEEFEKLKTKIAKQ